MLSTFTTGNHAKRGENELDSGVDSVDGQSDIQIALEHTKDS